MIDHSHTHHHPRNNVFLGDSTPPLTPSAHSHWVKKVNLYHFHPVRIDGFAQVRNGCSIHFTSLEWYSTRRRSVRPHFPRFSAILAHFKLNTAYPVQ